MAVSPQTTKRFFTVAEAAGLLGLSEPTLYRAIRGGEFPAIKVRGRYVVPAKAIDEMELSAMAAAVAGGTQSVPRSVA
jgi:excisionase family DNA binding protein